MSEFGEIADTVGMEPTQEQLDQAVEEWADSDGETTLAQWLMDRFGWDSERAERIVDRYPHDPDSALTDGSMRPVCRACSDGNHDQCTGTNSAGTACRCTHDDES